MRKGYKKATPLVQKSINIESLFDCNLTVKDVSKPPRVELTFHIKNIDVLLLLLPNPLNYSQRMSYRRREIVVRKLNNIATSFGFSVEHCDV